jgi:hypothetical protein
VAGRDAACRNARAREHGHRRKGGEQLIDPTGDKAHFIRKLDVRGGEISFCENIKILN